jgi:hypothetical protein
VRADLATKHRRMRRNPFTFLRGTFYRWAQTFPKLCPEAAQAPRLLSIGDLHVENFGIWRDAEGRPVWGINDFDEAVELPYTNDLVRLAASALLAIREARLQLQFRAACRAILNGYERTLDAGGAAHVLDDERAWLRHAAMAEHPHPRLFWQKLLRAPKEQHFPGKSRRVLRQALPRGASCEFHHRVAGVGSLGRPRIVALAHWHGALIAREAKALVPSALFWTTDRSGREGLGARAVHQAVRSPDPFLTFRRRWIVRRLSPDCRRIELSDLPRQRDEPRLLEAMGSEVANVHLGDPACRAIARHVSRLSGTWLLRAAQTMVEATLDDWREFRRDE